MNVEAHWKRWTCVFLLLGIASRAWRYLLQFPLWGDEAFIALNVIDRGFLGLTHQLRFYQIAPILFLWAERVAYLLLGSSEISMRLPSLMAGIGALFLFARFAKMTARPWTATLAIALLAVSYYPIRHSCEVKPYAFDLLASVLLLMLGARCLRSPGSHRPIRTLTLLMPLALLGSWPGVLVAGGVSVALLPSVYRGKDRKVWSWYLAFNLVLLITFLLSYLFIGQRQYVSMGSDQNVDWKAWFAPRVPLAFISFFIRAHVGNLFAYPVGGPNGGSILTFALCLMGGWRLWHRQRALLLLLVMPFVLTFIASVLQRYPYGGSARVAQHLAAPICLLMAFGITHLLALLNCGASRIESQGDCPVARLSESGLNRAAIASETLQPPRLWDLGKCVSDGMLHHAPSIGTIPDSNRCAIQPDSESQATEEGQSPCDSTRLGESGNERSNRLRHVIALTFTALILLVIGGAVRDAIKPYKTKADWDCRELCFALTRDAKGMPIVIRGPERLYPSFEWYLRRYGERVTWEIPDGEGRFCELRFYRRQDANGGTYAPLSPTCQMRSHCTHHLNMGWMPQAIHRCESIFWGKKKESGAVFRLLQERKNGT